MTVSMALKGMRVKNLGNCPHGPQPLFLFALFVIIGTALILSRCPCCLSLEADGAVEEEAFQ